ARQDELNAAIAGLPLPDGAQDTEIDRINLQQFPIYQVSITGGEGADAQSLRAIAQAEFLPAMTSAEGVSRVEIIGGAENEVQILLDATAIAESGVSMDAIGQVLQANNISMPVGSIQENGTTLPVRVDSQLTSIEDIENLLVGADGTTPITLGDVATVEIAPGKSSGVARTNGLPSIALDVYMSQGANTVETAEHVRSSLDEITER